MKSSALWMRRLADSVGMLAFYPLLYVLAYALDILGLMLALHLYLSAMVGVSGLSLWKVSWPDPRKAMLSGILLWICLIMLIAALVVPQHYDLLTNLGTIAPMLVIGLYAHDVSKVTGLRKLDRFGGLVVLGSFLVVVRVPLFVLIAFIVLGLGLGGVSQYLRVVSVMLAARSGTKGGT